MATTSRISEEDFSSHTEQLLQDLARRIAFSGFTISEIARATRMNWKTIFAASQGTPVRFDSYARLLCFLDRCEDAVDLEASSQTGCRPDTGKTR